MGFVRLAGRVQNARFDLNRKIGSKSIGAVCIVIGICCWLVVDWIVKSAPKRVTDYRTPYDRYVESITAYENAKGISDPGSMAERTSRKLQVGTLAPDFTLERVRQEETVSVSQLRGHPAVLVFGSFTCDRFAECVPALEDLYRKHKDCAKFLFINISEGGHVLHGYEFLLLNGASFDVHRDRIKKALEMKKLTMPAVVDVQRKAEIAYDAFPGRLVVVDANGHVARDEGRVLGNTWDFHALDAWLTAIGG